MPKALIVEDDEDHLEILSKCFQWWGWDVVPVLDPCLPFPPCDGVSLFVIDRALPGTSGADVLRRLREEGADAPAVVVTGMPPDVAENEFAGLGVELVVGKEVAYKTLCEYTKKIYPRDDACSGR